MVFLVSCFGTPNNTNINVWEMPVKGEMLPYRGLQLMIILGGDLHSSERQSWKMRAFISPCCFLEFLSSGILQSPHECHQLKNSQTLHQWQKQKDTTEVKRDQKLKQHYIRPIICVLQCRYYCKLQWWMHSTCVNCTQHQSSCQAVHTANSIRHFLLQYTAAPSSTENGASKWKVVYERVFLWHTSSYTLAYHSCQMSFCTDAKNLFVEKLFQIRCRVWTGLS